MTELRESGARVWVVVPAYNEASQIASVLAGLVGRFAGVVVVDDGSQDATAEAAHGAGATVLRHVINLGQGAALQTGLDYVLSRDADFVATFDADGQHNPDDLFVMLERLQASGADVALGSRFLGSAPGLSPMRRLLLMTATHFQRLTSGVRLSDAHNGLRLMRRAAAAGLRIRQNRMAHASEMISQFAERGLRIVEVPCEVRYTAYSLAKGQGLSGAFQILLDLAMRMLHR